MNSILLDKIDPKFGTIKCIQSSSSHVYIGTNNGYVLMYRIEKIISYQLNNKSEEEMTEKISATFERYYFMGKKKPVEKIELDEDPGFQALFILCDGILSMFTLEINLILKIPDVQGLTDFTKDLKSEFHRIVCIVKKKLIICHYVSDNYMKLKEIQLSKTPIRMEWYGKVLALCYKQQYSLINVDIKDDAEPSVIYSLDVQKGSQPVITLIQSELIILSGRVGVGIHMDDIRMGEPVSRSSISWTSKPILLSSCFPYIVAQFENKNLEIFSIYDREDKLKVEDVLYLSRGSKLGIYYANNESFSIINPIPFLKQIENLIKKIRCTEAFELFERTFVGSVVEKKIFRSQLNLDAGFACLFSRKIEDAFNYFKEAIFDVRELLFYFQKSQNLDLEDFIPQRSIDKIIDSNDNIIVDLKDKYNNQFFDKTRNHENSEGNQYLEMVDQIYLKACESLLNFLLDVRGKNKKGKEAAAIDTAIVKLMIKLGRFSILEQFLRKSNHILLNQMSILENSDRYLFAILLRTHNKIEFSLKNLKAISDHRSALETASILQEITNEKIIFEYAIWVMEKFPDIGLKIFTIQRNQSLNSENVIRFLKNFQKDDIFISNSSLKKYLEFIITIENNIYPQYHTQLALLYIDILTTKGTPQELKNEVRQKLHIHLASSAYYDSEFILKRLKDTPLYIERIFVYEKLNDHENVVDLYLNHLNDTQSALNYALGALRYTSSKNLGTIQKYDMKEFQSPRLLALLKVCFREDNFLKYGIDILNLYGEFLDASKALEIIPEHLDLYCLKDFLSKSIIDINQDKRDTTVMSIMSKSENIKIKQKHHDAFGKLILIKKSYSCCVCGEALSKGIAYYPDGSMAHFACRHPKLNIHPKTGRNFQIEPGDY